MGVMEVIRVRDRGKRRVGLLWSGVGLSAWVVHLHLGFRWNYMHLSVLRLRYLFVLWFVGGDNRLSESGKKNSNFLP